MESCFRQPVKGLSVISFLGKLLSPSVSETFSLWHDASATHYLVICCLASNTSHLPALAYRTVVLRPFHYLDNKRNSLVLMPHKCTDAVMTFVEIARFVKSKDDVFARIPRFLFFEEQMLLNRQASL